LSSGLTIDKGIIHSNYHFRIISGLLIVGSLFLKWRHFYICIFTCIDMLFFLYQVILTDAREGRDVIRSKIDIEIEEKINPSNNASQADIFNKLKARKDQIPIRPLTEGTL
jgi:hypothetical protein